MQSYANRLLLVVGRARDFLVSDAARSMTGSTLYVDAGVHIMG